MRMKEFPGNFPWQEGKGEVGTDFQFSRNDPSPWPSIHAPRFVVIHENRQKSARIGKNRRKSVKKSAKIGGDFDFDFGISSNFEERMKRRDFLSRKGNTRND